MRALRKLSAGQKSTRNFLDQYGGQLACVRYRYDEHSRKRFTTVKIIVEESDWTPPADPIADPVLVGLRVGLQEVSIQRIIKQAGGKWDRQKQVWELLSDQAIALSLTDRIVDQPVSTNRHQQSNNNRNSVVSTNSR
ncbi:MAG: hypothetical protein AAB401_03545 [Acidobacteriota bacterium]